MRESAGRELAACVPWRLAAAGPEVLLVTSRRVSGWVLPKGGIEPGEAPAGAALRECREEAGAACGPPVALGTVWSDVQRCAIHGYAAQVAALLPSWPEQGARRRRWFDAAGAAEAVRRPELAALIERALASISRGRGSPAGGQGGPASGRDGAE